MFYLNEARLAGNLGADAEVKACANGAVQFRFRLCTDKEWHSVECYAESEKAAQFLSGALVKGALVYVEGSIQTDTWVDKAGAKRSWKKIKAHRCQVISIPSADGGGMDAGADFNPDVPPELAAPAPAPMPAPAPAPVATQAAPAPAPSAGLRDRFRNLAR